MALWIKNPPALQEMWVGFLGGKALLEEGMATHSSTLARRIARTEAPWRATVHGVAKCQTRLGTHAAEVTPSIGPSGGLTLTL